MSTQKEICPTCNKVVYGGINPERMIALNETWHKTCFKCVECGRRLNLGNYLDHDGDPYCVPCHKEMYTYDNYPSRAKLGGREKKNKVVEKVAPRKVEDAEEEGPPPIPQGRAHVQTRAEEIEEDVDDESEEEGFSELFQKTIAAAGRELKGLFDNNVMSLFSSSKS